MKHIIAAAAISILPSLGMSQDLTSFTQSLVGFSCDSEELPGLNIVFGEYDGAMRIIYPVGGPKGHLVEKTGYGYKFSLDTSNAYMTKKDDGWTFHYSAEDGPFEAECSSMGDMPKELSIAIWQIVLGGSDLTTVPTQPKPDLAKLCFDSDIGAADIGGPFELVAPDGSSVTDADIITEPTLIYFGYTSCPDVCPIDVDRNAAVLEVLEEGGYSARSAFISLDPKRDTPEVVGSFAQAMHPRMLGLTGSHEQVRKVTKAYRVYYKAHAPIDGEYLIDHSTFTYLVTPDEGVLQFFRREMAPERIAKQLSCYIDAKKG